MKPTATCLLSAALCCALVACDRKPAVTIDPFPRFERRVLRLYERVQPLRASRLGLNEADSLLFTFGDEEIAAALAGIDSLLELVDSLSQSLVDPARRLDVAAAAVWARGQRFSLNDLEADRRGPILWCRLAAEALETIPLRNSPPAPGEATAYAARISRLPRLLENAVRRIGAPPPAHVELALDRLDDLIDGLDELAVRCERRWGDEAPDLALPREALLRFRRFIDGPLRERAHGSLIIGSENLARTLRYDEGLYIDPAAVTSDLEKTLRRINSRFLAVRRSEPAAGDGRGGVAAILARLDGGESRPRPETIRLLAPPVGAVDPFLTPPAAALPAVSWTIPCLGEESAPALRVDPSIAQNGGALRLALMSVSAGARAYDERLCRNGSPLAVLFAARLTRMAWIDLVVDRLVDESTDDGLRRTLLVQRLRETAVAIATIRLHGGAYTSDMAASYLVSNVPGMTGGEAASIVAAASADPAAAYPGIAILLTGELIRKASFEPGPGTPREKARRILLDRAGRPLPDIIEALGETRR